MKMPSPPAQIPNIDSNTNSLHEGSHSSFGPQFYSRQTAEAFNYPNRYQFDHNQGEDMLKLPNHKQTMLQTQKFLNKII